MSIRILDGEGFVHEPQDVTDLGYTTTRCTVCGDGTAFWPCPAAIEAAETP